MCGLLLAVDELLQRRLLSSEATYCSLLGLPRGSIVVPFAVYIRILSGNPKKEQPWSLWVGLGLPSLFG